MMGFIWFWLVAVMTVGYVVLDGFDLGVGILHPVSCRDEAEQRSPAMLRTSVRSGTATKSGSSPGAERSTSHSRSCTRPRSAASICL